MVMLGAASPYFCLDTAMPACNCQPALRITSYLFHLALHCRVAAGQGRSYHIRVTSERSIPIRANLRNSHPPLSAIRKLVPFASLFIAWQPTPIAPLLSTSRFAPKCIFFAEKEQFAQPLVDVDIVKMRKTARIVFALPPAAGRRCCWSRGVAFLQFRFYALFTFLPAPA